MIQEPQIRARLGTTAHSCEVVVLELRIVPIGAALSLRIFRVRWDHPEYLLALPDYACTRDETHLEQNLWYKRATQMLLHGMAFQWFGSSGLVGAGVRFL